MKYEGRSLKYEMRSAKYEAVGIFVRALQQVGEEIEEMGKKKKGKPGRLLVQPAPLSVESAGVKAGAVA